MTSTKTDEEIVDIVKERLERGFEGMRQMFRANDPKGGDTVTKDALLKIMYNVLGHIHRDQYERFLQNIGLAHKESIPFDMFVSRFKESEQIQRAWTNPVKRSVIADVEAKAHPEEELRDCEVFEWGQMKTGPHAFYLLEKALKDRKADIRSILPERCFTTTGVVDKVQMRHGLSELGIYLTDVEFGDFWERFDHLRRGAVPLKTVYNVLNLGENGEPRTPLPQEPKPRTPLAPSYRDPAKSYDKWFHKRHNSPHLMAKPKWDPRLTEGICGTPLGRPKGPLKTPPYEDDMEREIADEMAEKESPEAEAEKAARIHSVMNQRKHGKFDSLTDCLNYKFEERYFNMFQAFKLFDISDDGFVMRIDFRRVLKEFGFPLTAIELGNFVHCIGVTIIHGQVNYRNLLNKLLNRSDGFVSRVLDSKIQALQDGGQEDNLAEGDSVVEVACRLVEYLHSEYIKLAAALLRCDKNDKSVIPQAEMKRILEICLQDKMTGKQWDEVMDKCMKDDEGNIRYIDFLQSFDKLEPGAWNLEKHGHVTVPKQPVTHPVSKEVAALQLGKKEGFGDAVPPEKKEVGDRPVDLVREELRQFFADHLFDFDHEYHMLDRKASNSFTRWQFGALLKKCGFQISDKELEKVWMTLRLADNNTTSYNAVVMEFAPGHEAFHLPGVAVFDEARETCEERESTEVEKKGEQQEERVRLPPSPPFEQRTGRTPVDKHTYLQNAMKKLQPAVTANWERLKTGFRNLDPHGYGSVTYRQMQLLIDSCKSELTRDERNQICSQFDFKSNGRCNYLSFMKAFAMPKPPVSKFAYTPHTHKLEKQPADATEPITVSEALLRIRRKLIKHHKNLRRAFQKADKGRTGYISVPEFKAIFKECTLPVSDEDFYHILTEFDANMRGKLDYSEFLDAMLRM